MRSGFRLPVAEIVALELPAPATPDHRNPPAAVRRYTRRVTRTYVAVVVVQVVVLAALWLLSRHFAV